MKPNDPHRDRRPFLDESGKNPFADEGDAQQPLKSPQAPYAGSLVSGKPYTPGDYVMTSPHRSGFILTLGLSGLLLAPLGLCCGVFALGGGAVSTAAVVLGMADLRAMKTGAMNSEGEAMTRCGLILGVIGVLLCVGMVLFSIGMAMLLIISDIG